MASLNGPLALVSITAMTEKKPVLPHHQCWCQRGRGGSLEVSSRNREVTIRFQAPIFLDARMMWVRDAAARIEGRGYRRSFIVCRGFFADGENVMGRRKRWGGTRRVGSWVSSHLSRPSWGMWVARERMLSDTFISMQGGDGDG
jgi:hypothetical protein